MDNHFANAYNVITIRGRKRKELINMKKIIAGIVSVSLALAALTGCVSKGGKEETAEKKKFNLGHLNSTAHLLGFVAKEEGFFDEEGLDVTLSQMTSSTELVNGLESDKLDAVLLGAFGGMAFQSSGHDITYFGGAMTNGHGYIIKPESAKGFERDDINVLKGKNVAVSKNTTDDLELRILLKEKGIEIGTGSDKVNIVYFDSQKDSYAALLNDDIDATHVYSPYASLGQRQGYQLVYYDVDFDIFKNIPCCRQTAKTDDLINDKDTYVSFERALIKAYKFYQENEDKTVKDVKKYIDIEEDDIRTEVYGGYSISNPDPDKQATINVKDRAVELGIYEDFDLESHINTEIYKEALDSILNESPDDAVYKSMKEHFDQYE